MQLSSREFILCATSVFSVSLWCFPGRILNHRDTENTEVAQRNPVVHNQVMNSPAVQVMADDQQTQKFLTLLELSKAITSHHDL